ncbi:MAG: cupin domain-containing protein [SAR202 cluster bacterium]|jgi:mannose-6-phosphate isomerase-like protein (cupin superfamily)|nr:cupin domain-containing protein [SAR202 cluster bacterium]
MGKYRWRVAAVVALVVGIVGTADLVLQGTQPEGEAFRYHRVYSDENGVSHYGDATITFEMQDFAPPASPMGVSNALPAESVTFIHVPLGWDGEWHPTPTRQWAVILSGRVEITVGDEEARVFGPGDVILLDDTSGRGHLTNVVSPEGATVMMVPSRPE